MESTEMAQTLSPRGDLDELVLEALQAQLETFADDTELVLDFTGVTFCGSGCIRLLIETSNRLTSGGGSMIIRNARDIVRRAFTVGAVDFLLEASPPSDGSATSSP